MSGKKTLYDLLEVSNGASAEAIRASFDRLTGRFEDGTLRPPAGLDVQSYYNLIKDAYLTLGNSTKRQAYDRRLAGATPSGITYYDEPTQSSVFLKVFLAMLVLGGCYFGYKVHRDGELEKARLIAEARKAELDSIERQREAESLALARQQQAIESQQEARQRAEMEQARREADQVSRQLQRNQEQYKREEERARQEEERRRQNEARQQQYRADAERQRAVAAAQQRDYARPRAAKIENKPERLSADR